MKVKGIVTLNFLVDGEVVRTIQKTNTISEWLFSRILFDTSSTAAFKDRGFISNAFLDNSMRLYLDSTPGERGLFKNNADFDTFVAQSSTNSWTINKTVANPFAELNSRFTNPPSLRTFDTIGLMDSNTLVIAWVQGLESTPGNPCTQDVDEVLDVNYRLEFSFDENNGNRVPPDYQEYWIKEVVLGETTNSDPSRFYTSPFAVPSNTNYDYFQLPSDELSLITNFFSPGNGWVNDQTYFFKQKTDTFEKTEYVGKILNSLGISRYEFEDKIALGNYIDFEISGLTFGQGIFSHDITAPGPFEDIDSFALGTGSITLTDSWSGSFPELYRITIQNNGQVSDNSATYTVERRKHFGFDENTFQPIPVSVPWINQSVQSFDRFYGFDNNNYLRISDTQVISWASNGLTLFDLQTGNTTIFDATSGFNYTDIVQVATDGYINDIHDTVNATNIYIACRQTGLWRITLAGLVQTNLSPDPCYAVAYTDTDIYAVFADRIAKDSNFATPLTLTYAPLAGDFTSVRFMQADRTNGDIAIVFGANSLIWWNESTQTTALDGPTGLVLENQNELAPAWYGIETRPGFDAENMYKLDFGTTSKVLVGNNAEFVTFPIVIGDKLFIPYANGGSDTRLYQDNQDNTFTQLGIDFEGLALNREDDNQKYAIYLGAAVLFHGAIGGIAVVNRATYLTAMFNNSPLAWESYGWDGANWVLGNTSAKPVHSGAEAIPGGVSISFADGASGTSFIATDYYTQVYCDGLMKDNVTTVTFEQKNFIRSNEFDVNIPSTVIPGTGIVDLASISGDADFFRLYAFTDEFVTLNLNGTEVSAYLLDTDLNTPAVNEVNMFADGTLQFNAANIGDTLTGSYSYMRY